MKKLISVVLCLTVVMTCAYATPNSESDVATDTFYVVSKDCPDEYVEYAIDNVGRFVYGNDSYDISEVDTFMLGSPFTFSQDDADIFYFPVYADGEFIYLFRVYSASDGEIYGVLSNNLVAELKALIGQTSQDTPMYLNLVDGDIVATVNNSSTTLYSYPDGIYEDEFSLPSTMNPDNIEELGVEEVSPQVTFILPAYNSSRALTSRYLNLFMGAGGYYVETQGAEEWCTAYSAAAIMRYVANSGSPLTSVKARDIMEYFYGPNVSPNVALAESQAVAYGQIYGLRPTFVYRAISVNEVATEMSYARPVMLTMENSVSGSNHAVVLRGFDSSAGTYSIWNPWYTSYETYSIGGVYVPSSSTAAQYSYSHIWTTYNWGYTL